MLHDLGGTAQRVVDALLDRWLAHRDQPGLTGSEFGRRLLELGMRMMTALRAA